MLHLFFYRQQIRNPIYINLLIHIINLRLFLNLMYERNILTTFFQFCFISHNFGFYFFIYIDFTSIKAYSTCIPLWQEILQYEIVMK